MRSGNASSTFAGTSYIYLHFNLPQPRSGGRRGGIGARASMLGAELAARRHRSCLAVGRSFDTREVLAQSFWWVQVPSTPLDTIQNATKPYNTIENCYGKSSDPMSNPRINAAVLCAHRCETRRSSDLRGASARPRQSSCTLGAQTSSWLEGRARAKCIAAAEATSHL